MAQRARHERRRFGRLVRWLLGLVVFFNLFAFAQAYGSTHYVDEGTPLAALLAQPFPQRLAALVIGAHIMRPQNHSSPADHYLPYETRTIALPNDEHLEAWYVPHPQPRAIALMFVGYAGVKEGALTPAAKFYQWGYSSLLVDFRGVGGSSRSDQTVGIREADDVAAAFAYARAQNPELPIVLYGISMGASSVLRAVALNGIEPAAIIVEAPFDRLLTTTRHRFEGLWLPASPATELMLFWGGVQMGVDPFAHNPVEYATKIAVPTMLLFGEQDPWILPAERQALVAALRGRVEVVTFPGQGHGGPYVYGDEERWDTTMRAFLDTAF